MDGTWVYRVSLEGAEEQEVRCSEQAIEEGGVVTFLLVDGSSLSGTIKGTTYSEKAFIPNDH